MKRIFNIYTVLVILLTILGGILRFYKITVNPPELNIDEISFGYNAYSILKTGRDEYGKFLPLTFESVGDYKNPIPVYMLVPSIAIFGLNEFAVRFPSALLATIAIPLYFLIFTNISKNKIASLIATFLLTVSPWSLYYSRYHYEHHYAVLFLSLGIYLFLGFKESGRKITAFFSALLMVSTIYTTFAERLFLPLFILGLLVLFRKELLRVKYASITFILSVAVLALPMLLRSLFGEDSARAGMVFLTKDIDYTRYGILDSNYSFPIFLKPLYNLQIFLTFWAGRFLSYFDSGFLYFTGLGMTTEKTLGLGITYLFELPLLLTGTILLIRNKISNKALIVLWLLLGLFPASLANNDQSPGRSLIILPILCLLSGVGGFYLIKLFRFSKSLVKKYLLLFVFASVFVWQLTKSILIFAVHFPIQKGEGFMDGMKEVMTYAIEHESEYDEIVIDPYRGIEAPNIVGIPHMYYLFYSKYSPQKYQTIERIKEDEHYHFDKITIRKVYWPTDRSKRNTLFIASPWSIIPKEIGESRIVKEAFVRKDKSALIVVSNE